MPITSIDRSEKVVEEYISSTTKQIRKEMIDLANWKINSSFRDGIEMKEKEGVDISGSNHDSDESIQQE